jgi:hypothetical protein
VIVAVSVTVGVCDAVGVREGVAVSVGVRVSVGVSVRVAVLVSATVAEAVTVGVVLANRTPIRAGALQAPTSSNTIAATMQRITIAFLPLKRVFTILERT